MAFIRKPSSNSAVAQSDEFPSSLTLPELTGRPASAFPELAQWVKEANASLNQFWESVHGTLRRINDDVASTLNQSVSTTGQNQKTTGDTLANLNLQLASIQQTIKQFSADATVLNQLQQISQVISRLSDYGKTLLASKDGSAAKVNLGLKPGGAILNVDDATATAPTITDVGAAFDQATLNANFANLETSVNALIADVDGIRQTVNALLAVQRDQNLIANQ